MIAANLDLRGTDDWGSGHYNASRGRRRHKGIDYAAMSGQEILAPISGIVSKLGYPYADDLGYRYVEITTDNGLRHRVFYIEPCVDVGNYCIQNHTVIGNAQDLDSRYSGITNHIHYEIIMEDGEYVNPERMK